MTSKRNFTIVTICVIIVAVFVLDFLIRLDQPSFQITDLSRSKGSSVAPVQIVEFIDFQCMECARGARFLAKYMADYPDESFLSVKYFPLTEMNSMVSARFAHCTAQQDVFWPFHDLVLSKQVTWRTLDNVRPYLTSLAREAGADTDLLQECVEKKETQKAIFQDRILGESYFVSVTPTYFVNGEMVVGVEALKEKLLNDFLYE